MSRRDARNEFIALMVLIGICITLDVVFVLYDRTGVAAFWLTAFAVWMSFPARKRWKLLKTQKL